MHGPVAAKADCVCANERGCNRAESTPIPELKIRFDRVPKVPLLRVIVELFPQPFAPVGRELVGVTAIKPDACRKGIWVDFRQKVNYFALRLDCKIAGARRQAISALSN